MLALSATSERSITGLFAQERSRGGDEAALVRRAKAGDAAALEWIAREQESRVRRLLLRLLGARPDLDDLVQNVFVEFCRALPGFRGDSALSTFIGGITVRVARRAMRPTAWRRRRQDGEVDAPSIHPGPDGNTHAAEQLRRTRRALTKISEKKRVAFVLWALEGMPVEEVAATVGASVTATRSRIFYAQKELRRLAQNDPYLRELVEGT